MTTAQRTAIASPADGLMVYDTDLKLSLLQLIDNLDDYGGYWTIKIQRLDLLMF
jgi:hypothetical protein